jgi:FkbM family methyltransferase
MNISIIEALMAHFRYWVNFLKMLVILNKTYEYFFKLLIQILRCEFPIDSVLKNKNHLLLGSFNAVFLVAHSQRIPNIKYDVKMDIVIITSSEFPYKEIKFHGGVNNGDIIYGFLGGDYAKLPVRGKTVIDIGANIGDTPIYFTLHGANRVIGIEPYPKNYELAIKNVLTNEFSDKIMMILAGCSSKMDQIIIDPEYESNIESQLKNSTSGESIPLLTLEDILKKYNVENGSILKMDCEGCEYDVILHSSDEILKRFSHIQIEYHSGYKNLKEKLERCGFKIKVSPPVATDVINTIFQFFQNYFNTKEDKEIDSTSKKRHKIKYCGFIYAVREDKMNFK